MASLGVLTLIISFCLLMWCMLSRALSSASCSSSCFDFGFFHGLISVADWMPPAVSPLIGTLNKRHSRQTIRRFPCPSPTLL